jgi:hypothetical protein
MQWDSIQKRGSQMEPENTEVQTESPELALEKQRTKRLELEARARREQREAAETREQTKQELFTQNLRRELAAIGLDFYVDDRELQQILEYKNRAKFLVRDTGAFSVEIEGKQLPFGELIQRFAVENPTLLQDRSQIAHLVKPQAQLSRADFPTAAAKARYINEFGLRSWENLPATSVPDVEKSQLTKELYLKMTTAQKVKLNLSEVEIGRLLKHGKL